MIHFCAQHSSEWYSLRLGRFTASVFADLMPAKSKPVDSWTETQTKQIYATVAERMTGKAAEMFQSRAMEWGIVTEAQARRAYEMATGYLVDEVGFIAIDDWVGCSPDGLISDNGMLETKCPNSDTHLMYRVIPGKLRESYYWQCMGQLWISGREWVDLCSYDPRYIDESKRLFTVRIERDEDAIARLEKRIQSAVEIAETIQGE